MYNLSTTSNILQKFYVRKKKGSQKVGHSKKLITLTPHLTAFCLEPPQPMTHSKTWQNVAIIWAKIWITSTFYVY